MKYYPLFLHLAGRRCLVVGGGQVAEKKVESLLRAGAQVTVVSPELTPRLAALAAARTIECHQRPYMPGDLAGCFLAYAATSDEHAQSAIAVEAGTAGVLLNVVNRAQLSDFIAPAIVERGDLCLAVSTAGASPALAKRIRQDLEKAFGSEYELALELLGRLRRHLATPSRSSAERQRIFSTLVNSPLLDYLRQRQTHEIDRLLAQIVGDDVSLATLGMELG